MKKTVYTDKYSGKSYSIIEDVTEDDRKAIRAKAEKKLMQKAKSKKVRDEALKAYRNRG